MKKLLLSIFVATFALTNVNAQEKEQGNPTAKGNWQVGFNTSPTGSFDLGPGFFLFRRDGGDLVWSVGGEFGYFVIDNLALNAGIGYTGNTRFNFDEGSFNWKIGSKYYIEDKIPLAIDLSGSVSKFVVDFSSLWTGISAGYAWFVSDNVSIEPNLKYSIPLNDDAGNDNILRGNVSFNFFF